MKEGRLYRSICSDEYRTFEVGSIVMLVEGFDDNYERTDECKGGYFKLVFGDLAAYGSRNEISDGTHATYYYEVEPLPAEVNNE